MTAQETPAAVQQPAEPELRTFYSRNGALAICINTGTYITGADNRQHLIGHKIIEFSRMADGYGILTTRDPETIAALEKRRAAGYGDVYTPEEYNDKTEPESYKRARIAEERDRVVVDNNRLLKAVEDLKAELAKRQPSK